MNKKEAQMMPPTDPMMGGPPMGMDPMMGGVPQPQLVPEDEIKGPIESIGAILYDFDVEDYIAKNPDKGDAELAIEIWTAYGGDAHGDIIPDREGQRKESDENRTPEEVKKERDSNNDRKWERLKVGKTIADITSLEEITGLIKSLIYGTIKKFKTQPEEDGGMGGGMGPFASAKDRMRKEAFIEDDILKEYNEWKRSLIEKFKK